MKIFFFKHRRFSIHNGFTKKTEKQGQMTARPLQCYARRPKALFRRFSSERVVARSSCEYRDAELAVSLGNLPQGTKVHMVRVDWHRCRASAYLCASDAMNGIEASSEELSDHFPPTAQSRIVATRAVAGAAYYEATEFVRETFQFLQRGHSLFHPQCKCPTVPREELGLRNSVWDTCTVGGYGAARSMPEIELELGVRHSLVYAAGEVMPFFEALTRLARLEVNDACELSSPLCCIPAALSCSEDILAAAKALFPRPVLCKQDTWSRDIEHLQTEGLVRVVPCDSGVAVFWIPRDKLTLSVDQDIRALWNSTRVQLPSAPVGRIGYNKAAPKIRRNHTKTAAISKKRRQCLTLFHRKANS